MCAYFSCNLLKIILGADPHLIASFLRSFMGSDGRARQLQASVTAYKTVLLVGVLPFTVGLLTILLIFRAAPRSLHSRQLIEQFSENPPLGRKTDHTAQKRFETPCNCAGSEEIDRLKGALTKQSVTKVLDAANSTDPHQQIVRVNEDALPSTFLFAGVLSGRGYR